MDEIRLGPKRDFRPPSGRWLVVAVAAGLIAAAVALVVTGGGSRHGAGSPRASAVRSTLAPSPTGAPGTVLLTCDSALWGPLNPNWRAGSLRAGPLWFVDGRQLGYVHYSGSQGTGRAIQRHGVSQLVVMAVEVQFGSTVVVKPTAGARPYFRFFVDGFGPGGRL